ncbi:MAG TPA: glycine--tRNA ligase subunit beta [Terriglobia bacterium]
MSEATLPLLIEVGCEEIPARFLPDGEKKFGERLLGALYDSRLIPADLGSVREPRLKTYSTPRRIVAYVPALLESQPDLVEEVTGPPAKIAFDAEGKPTRAAESFAAKNGVRVEELLQIETPKGLYVSAKRTTIGLAALEVLTTILPQVIKAATFPKSMIWEGDRVRFVRPIRWLVALLGEGERAQIVPFEVAGVRSGSLTFRHRLTRKPEAAVIGFKDYTSKLRRGHVEIDGEKRRKRIRRDIKALLEVEAGRASELTLTGSGAVPQTNGDDGLATAAIRPRLINDPALEDWIVTSTEWPRPILGSFQPRFLELPREILITVMRGHQKYFAVELAGGPAASVASESTLAPQFVTVLNVPGDPQGIIRRGHERVLTARLEDAKFFWHADQKILLRDRVSILDRVTYHEKLGSYTDKIIRMSAIAEYICAELEKPGKARGGEQARALRAIKLCKCDLTTQMVQEFTELQGIVGGLYAKAQGEREEVWQAIYDQYRPINLEDERPRSAVGAVVSLADKLDAVVAGFSVGLEPTGSSDPFGLRRAGNGIVKIAIEAAPGLDLYRVASNAHQRLQQKLSEPAAGGWGHLESFFSERLAFYLDTVVGLKYDTVRAVLSPQVHDSWNVPSRALERAQALHATRDLADFQSLAAAAKRTRNILTKSAKPQDFAAVLQVDPALFKAPEERELYNAYEGAQSALAVLEANSDYAGAFRRLAQLRPAVDQFFDKVMVMDEDRAVRANRLQLLTDLDSLAFRRFADISEIEPGVGGPPQDQVGTR